MSLLGYASATSVVQGSALNVHLSSTPASDVQVSIVRVGATDGPLRSLSVSSPSLPMPDDASENGCGWPVGFTLEIPSDWPSGFYQAHLTNGAGEEAAIDFLVRAAQPGSASPILFSFAVTTMQAYNDSGGKSLYAPTNDERARQVSFDRPGSLVSTWETKFLRWLGQNGYAVECCTSFDLHTTPTLPYSYELLLSVGHDEYWSGEMRDTVEAYIRDGGHVAFFAANVSWWQVRFDNNNRTMICYKAAEEDPLKGVDNSRLTVEWSNPLVHRPENRMTGVSYRKGAGYWQECNTPMSDKAYTVRRADHWVFAGTGLQNGDTFGQGESLVGYETDAADYNEVDGVPQVTGDDGTPASFVILATADLSDWGPCGQAGRATMGLYEQGGTVFTAATIGWADGLDVPTSKAHQITRNVLDHLLP